MPFGLSLRRRRYPLRHRGGRQPCNLCGGDDVAVVRTRDRYLDHLVNVMCRHCGLVFIDPMPTEEDVYDYYRSAFWKSSQGKDEPTAKRINRDRRFARNRMEKIAYVLKPGARILDVGSGSGEFLALANAAGFQTEGIEPNLGYARYAERVLGVAVHAEPLAAVDFGERRFDHITCNHVLEHMRDPLGALRRFHMLLEPDGHLDVFVPDLSDPDSSPLRHLHAGHLYGFTPETLVMMAAKAGFESLGAPHVGTWLVFRRLAAPDPDWFRFPHHAAASEAMFRERTLLRHLLSGASVIRLFARARARRNAVRGPAPPNLPFT